jgi:hypothetical protein
VADETNEITRVPATLRNTRRVAFAMWRKLSLPWAIFQLAAGFIVGFFYFVIPFGQLQFWLAARLTDKFGQEVAELIYNAFVNTPAAALVVLAINAAFLYAVMNWLLASHVGRSFGHVRLPLQRVQ